MTHSRLFEKIKNWYELGFWSKNTLKLAVTKNRITEDEYKEITGENYSTEKATE